MVAPAGTVLAVDYAYNRPAPGGKHATLIVSEFVTLDGVMQAPGGEPTHPHAGWTMEYGVPERSAYKLDEVGG